jgi:hypothetical protein
MKVELFELGTCIPCAMGSIVNVTSMDCHAKARPPGTCLVSITSIKKGLVKLPFPNSEGTKLKDVENGVVLWLISKLTIAKYIMMHILSCIWC